MKKIFLLAVALTSIQLIYAQGGYFAFTYSIGFPTGDLKEYIDQPSFRGANMEFYWHVKPNIDAGIEVGWNVFYAEESAKVYNNGTASIHGKQFRYTNAVPLIAGVRWRKTGGTTAPYVGLGVGTTSVNRSTDFGLYRISNNTWQFCVRPEAGLIHDLGGGTGLTVGAKYYLNFKNDALDAQSYATINVGFVFSMGR
jgi:outer membrane protein